MAVFGPGRNQAPAQRNEFPFAVFLLPDSENKYDLSINRYKEVQYEAVEYDPPLVILDKLDALEAEIQQDLRELREMVG